MKYKLKINKEAKRDLKGLEKNIQKRIAQKVKFYTLGENPLKHAKKLSSPFEGLYRFRVGDYRIIFGIDNNDKLTVLTITAIKHRKDIYN